MQVSVLGQVNACVWSYYITTSNNCATALPEWFPSYRMGWRCACSCRMLWPDYWGKTTLTALWSVLLLRWQTLSSVLNLAPVITRCVGLSCVAAGMWATACLPNAGFLWCRWHWWREGRWAGEQSSPLPATSGEEEACVKCLKMLKCVKCLKTPFHTTTQVCGWNLVDF